MTIKCNDSLILRAAVATVLALAAQTPRELPAPLVAAVPVRKPEDHHVIEPEPIAAELTRQEAEQAPVIPIPPGRQLYDLPTRRNWEAYEAAFWMPPRNSALLDSAA